MGFPHTHPPPRFVPDPPLASAPTAAGVAAERESVPGTWRRSPGHLPCCQPGGGGGEQRRWVWGESGKRFWGAGVGGWGLVLSVPAALRLFLLQGGVSGGREGRRGHKQPPVVFGETVARRSGGKKPSSPPKSSGNCRGGRVRRGRPAPGAAEHLAGPGGGWVGGAGGRGLFGRCR